MCDERTLQEMTEYLSRTRKLSRREFGAMSAGTGLMAVLPAVANAQSVTESDVDVPTPDGTADCYFVHPSSGRHPGVIVWPDILGLRPAFRQMGKRLAESGYSVLVVNPYYRGQRAPVVPEGASFADESVRNTVFPLARGLTEETTFTDARALVAFLDEQPSVDPSSQMGTTGYCMGGPFIIRTAAAVPDWTGAAVSFHGGNLVTDAPDSPHRLIPKTDASFLFAIAASDDMSQPEAKTVLRDAFDDAGLDAEIEVYTGTQHGWCPPDSAVYDEAQAERAWSRLLALFDTALG
jgi:carboxymethylenebutenolidase